MIMKLWDGKSIGKQNYPDVFDDLHGEQMVKLQWVMAAVFVVVGVGRYGGNPSAGPAAAWLLRSKLVPS